MTCPSCTANRQFDTATARRDLRRFQRRGPDAPTRALLAGVLSRSLPAGASLLDVGGGVGAIHHDLLDHGFARATHVDASEAYLAAAEDESGRRRHGGRVQFVYGDLVDVGPTLGTVDVVTMDRVVCCNADFASLLRAAASRARHLVAFSYPRPRWITRRVIEVYNAFRRLRRDPFAVYLHAPAAMTRVLVGEGLAPVWSGGTWIWAVAVFARDPAVIAGLQANRLSAPDVPVQR